MVKDGDKITVDAETKVIQWHVTPEVEQQRRKEWESQKRELKVKRGVLLRYARDVAVSHHLASCLVPDVDAIWQPANVGAYCD